MSYEINVSKNGRHVFATHERSLDGLESEAVALFELFREKFPASEGYAITLRKFRNSSEEIAHYDIVSECATLENAKAYEEASDKFLFCLELLDIGITSPGADSLVCKLEDEFDNILSTEEAA